MPHSTQDVAQLDRLISQCFEGGQLLRRELRLTEEQAEGLAQGYPVTLHPMGGGWYDVALESAPVPQ